MPPMPPIRGAFKNPVLVTAQRRLLVSLARKSCLFSPVCSPIHPVARPVRVVPLGHRFYASSSEASTTDASPPADTPPPVDKPDKGECERKPPNKERPRKKTVWKSPPVFKDINAWSVELPRGNENPAAIRINHSELPEPVWVRRAWLRDACRCAACVDPSSGQKRFSTADVPVHPRIENVIRADDGSLEVSWADDFHTHDTHLSRYPPSFCEKVIIPIYEKPPKPRVMWDKAMMEEQKPSVDYVSFMEDQASFESGLRFLYTHGLFILRGVPSSEDMVEKIAAKIGTIQNSLYGMTWDVVSKPNAENVAYTDSYLGLHQDLLYMSNIPRIQILHCIKNTCDGGESLFRDGRRAFFQISQKLRPDDHTLFRRMIVYEYNKNGHFYLRRQHVLSKKREGVLWSPQFQSSTQQLLPYREGPRDNFYERWHEDLKMVKDILETEKEIYELKLNEGECVLFDNHRVLHGRRKFDTSSGERWLRGAYVDNDSFMSIMRSLNIELHD